MYFICLFLFEHRSSTQRMVILHGGFVWSNSVYSLYLLVRLFSSSECSWAYVCTLANLYECEYTGIYVYVSVLSRMHGKRIGFYGLCKTHIIQFNLTYCFERLMPRQCTTYCNNQRWNLCMYLFLYWSFRLFFSFSFSFLSFSLAHCHWFTVVAVGICYCYFHLMSCKSAKPSNNNCTRGTLEKCYRFIYMYLYIRCDARTNERQSTWAHIQWLNPPAVYILIQCTECEILLMLTPITKTYIVSFSEFLHTYTQIHAKQTDTLVERKVNGWKWAGF